MSADINSPNIKRLLVIQTGVCVFMVLVACVFSLDSALSAFLGGLVAIVPAYVFAKKLFKHQGARAARQIVKNFYFGEFLKIITTVCLFSLVFIFFEVVPLAFFITYIVVVITHWFAPLIIDNKQNRPESD